MHRFTTSQIFLAESPPFLNLWEKKEALNNHQSIISAIASERLNKGQRRRYTALFLSKTNHDVALADKNLIDWSQKEITAMQKFQKHLKKQT